MEHAKLTGEVASRSFDPLADRTFECTNEMAHKTLQDTFKKRLQDLRLSVKHSMRKEAKVPLNRMNFYINLMDLGIESLKEPGAATDVAKDVYVSFWGKWQVA